MIAALASKYTMAYQRMIEATHTHPHTMGAMAHRAGGRQAPRPAEPDPASARQHRQPDGGEGLATTQGLSPRGEV
jgi:hypothetical protein